jgi:molecular chaperone DnaK
MLKEADSNRAQDQALRQQVDARNELDSAAYQLERRLTELGDAAPMHERARAETLIADARQAVNEEAPLERVRSLTGELQQAAQALNARAAATSAAGGPGVGTSPSADASSTSSSGDDVIDAEFDRT